MRGKTCVNGHRMRELQEACAECGAPEKIEGMKVLGFDPKGWPRTCMWKGCDADTTQVCIIVETPSGKLLRTKASGVMHGKNLREGFRFVDWICRCDHHTAHELHGRGKDWRETLLQEYLAKYGRTAPRSTAEQQAALTSAREAFA